MDPIEQMLAERECAKLQIAYATTADRGDADGFTALFSTDASIVIPEYPPFTGHAAIHASLVALTATGVTQRHVITNQHVTVTGPNTAEGGCYLIVFNNHGPADAAGLRDVRQPGTIGDYADQFIRTADGWRFRERRLTRVFRPLANLGERDGDR